MEVSVEVTDGLERRITVKLSPEPIEQAIDERIKKAAKTAKIEGFRPGKVPVKLIEKKYGPGIRMEVLNDRIQKTLYEAVQQERLFPTDMPNVKITHAEPNQPVEYTATFEVYPDITLVDLKGIDVEQWESEVTEADIDSMIEKLRKQAAIWDEVDRAAQNDDKVMIDFEGLIDNEPFEGGQASNVPLVLGSNSMIPGFEAGIIGAASGDEFEIDVTFPEDYFHQSFAGKPAKFKIKLHQVLEPSLPTVNEEFIKRFQVKEGGIEAFRQKIREDLGRELNRGLKMKNKTLLFDKLLELNEIPIPKSLVNQEIEVLKKQALENMGMTDEKKAPEIPRERFESQAIRRVRLGLLIAEVAKVEELKPDEARLREMIEDIAKDYEYADQIIKWYYEDEKRLTQFQMVVLEDQVVEKLRGGANLVKKAVGYEELLKG